MAISLWAELIRERVEQGPISYDALIAEAAPLVPPGRAYRVALGAMDSERRRGGYGPERQFTDVEGKKDQRIRYGQRTTVAGILHSMHIRGRLVTYEEDGVRMVALGPHPWSDPKPSAAHSSQVVAGILEAVRDDPMEYIALFEHVKHLVDRQKAIGRAVRARRQNRKYDGGDPHTATVRELRLTDEDNFNRGARAIFQYSVRALSRSGRVVVVGSGRERRVVARGPNWVQPRS